MKRRAAFPALLCFFLLISVLTGSAQSVGVGTNTPDASAVLDVSGTHGGLLIPRLTLAQRDAISSPANGLMVFVTTDNSFYCYNGSWKKLSAAGEVWQLQGNAGTNSGTHYIGTNDTAALTFAVRGIPRLQISDKGYLHLSGDGQNTAIGYESGHSISSGVRNHFTGYRAGHSNTTGSDNYFSGYQAGFSNIAGFENHFSGIGAGFSNTTAVQNHFEGFNAGYNTTTGQINTFIGFEAGLNNTFGEQNLYVGHGAGRNANATGNTFIGTAAGTVTTSGFQNTIVGAFAGLSNTSGFYNNFSGFQAGSANTVGAYNCFAGAFAGVSSSTGIGNCFNGYGAGITNTTGSNNTIIGTIADVAISNLTNAGAIGYNARVSQSNSFVIGGTGPDAVSVGIGVTAPAHTLHVNGSVAGVGAYNNISDSRLKTNISPIKNALAGILQLRAVSYDWKKEEYTQFKFDDKRQIGFLAQELEKIFPEAVTLGADGFYTIAYSQLIPVVVQGIKEQQSEIENLKTENTQMKAAMEILAKEIEVIKRQIPTLQK